MRVNEKQNWWVSPTNVAYHFGTSGTAVAAATAITHPLGLLLFLRGCNFGFLGLVRNVLISCFVVFGLSEIR